MDDLSERRHNGELDSAVSASGTRASARQVDDWLGETFEDDWGEPTDAPAERGRAVVADDLVPSSSERSDDRAPRSRPVDAAAARRAAVERRRIVAGLIAVTVLAAGVGTAVIIVRSGDEEPAATALEPDTTAPTTTPTDTSTTPTTTTPSDTSTTPTSPTTPSTPDTSSFTLPAGTKLRPGEDADAAVVTELQRALKSAGYDPGPIDGTYGAKTVAAVVALQQASGLSADGVVGPDTAAALNDALAAG
jgi:cytoskeletal protein RodZ